MLGALTLPSVSTGFTSDSKAMVPVSIQGMADKVQKMSPLETMQEVFFDIRDGILILGDVFGPPGRKAISEKLPDLIKKKKADEQTRIQQE